jgi:hypothetical protein
MPLAQKWVFIFSSFKIYPLEKIFASYTSDKRLITRIHRELKKLNSSKNNEPIKKWASELNRTFSKEEIKMAKNT